MLKPTFLRLLLSAALGFLLASCAAGGGGKANLIYQSLRPHQKVTLVYEGTTTVARQLGNALVSTSDRRSAPCRIECVLTYSGDGLSGGYYAGETKYWINGQPVDTSDYTRIGAIPVVLDIFTSVNERDEWTNPEGTFEAIVARRPAGVSYAKNVGPSGGSLMMTVTPNAGFTTAAGRGTGYALMQEQGRFTKQAHVSDSIPGRVVWCMTQMAADNGIDTDRIELRLTSVKTE